MTAEPSEAILRELYVILNERKNADPETSYTARLYAKGVKKIAQKLGEEAVEAAIAAVAESKEHLVRESADLLYHLLVLWADRGLKPSEVWMTLAAREGISGIEEKKARGQVK